MRLVVLLHQYKLFLLFGPVYTTLWITKCIDFQRYKYLNNKQKYFVVTWTLAIYYNKRCRKAKDYKILQECCIDIPFRFDMTIYYVFSFMLYFFILYKVLQFKIIINFNRYKHSFNRQILNTKRESFRQCTVLQYKNIWRTKRLKRTIYNRNTLIYTGNIMVVIVCYWVRQGVEVS